MNTFVQQYTVHLYMMEQLHQHYASMQQDLQKFIALESYNLKNALGDAHTDIGSILQFHNFSSVF